LEAVEQSLNFTSIRGLGVECFYEQLPLAVPLFATFGARNRLEKLDISTDSAAFVELITPATSSTAFCHLKVYFEGGRVTDLNDWPRGLATSGNLVYLEIWFNSPKRSLASYRELEQFFERSRHLDVLIMRDYPFDEEYGRVLSRALNPGLRTLDIGTIVPPGFVARCLQNCTDLQFLWVSFERCRRPGKMDWDAIGRQAALRKLRIYFAKEFPASELVCLENIVKTLARLQKLYVGAAVPIGWMERFRAAAPKFCQSRRRRKITGNTKVLFLVGPTSRFKSKVTTLSIWKTRKMESSKWKRARGAPK
jgi:hypothetical protein